MKSIKTILAIACCALLALSLIAAQAEELQISKARFALQDMNVANVYVGATPEEARAVFGDPADSITETSGATDEKTEIYHYAGLTLTFSAGKLTGAEVSGDGVTGPRGVTVGMTLNDVAYRFYMDPDTNSANVLYTSGYVEMLDSQLPPCGYVQRYDDGTYSLNYVAPEAPFSAETLSDPMDYIYETLATFIVSFGADGIVQSYTWTLGVWAE